MPYPKPSTLNANLTAGLLGPLLEETNGTILLELLAAAEDFGLPAGSFRHVRSCALYICINFKHAHVFVYVFVNICIYICLCCLCVVFLIVVRALWLETVADDRVYKPFAATSGFHEVFAWCHKMLWLWSSSLHTKVLLGFELRGTGPHDGIV